MSCVKIKWIDINSFDVHIKKVITMQTSSLPIYFPKFDQIDILKYVLRCYRWGERS